MKGLVGPVSSDARRRRGRRFIGEMSPELSFLGLTGTKGVLDTVLVDPVGNVGEGRALSEDFIGGGGGSGRGGGGFRLGGDR